MTRAAAIDIGTNTVLLVVAEGDREQPRVLAERATITRLGAGVDATRRIDAAAAERTLACLRAYADEMARLGVERRAAVGTSALRDAGGGPELIAEATRVLGVAPRVIDGLEEAELSFVGATSGLGMSGALTVFDIGGGSTEIVSGTLGAETSIAAAASLDVGSVRLTERHVKNDPPSAAELEKIRADVRSALATIERPPPAPLVGVAGTLTTLAAVDRKLATYDAGVVHGATLSRRTLDDLLARLAALPLAERRTLPGLEPARADVIVAGAVIACELVDWARAEEVVISDRGVRWGLLQRLLDA